MLTSAERLLWSIAALWFTLAFATPLGRSAEIKGDPSNYRALLTQLKPGDTLNLQAGAYARLPITNLHGTPAAWITIAGPASGGPAVVVGDAGHNTVEILNSSYVALKNLRIESRGIAGTFGISAKDGDDNLTHDIRVEDNVLVGQDGGQQTVGISTKTATWGWIIRNNQIFGAGTGLYLGQSDGTLPFVAGLIENNLIRDTIGYNIEIKDQVEIPAIEGMPIEPTSTIIRNNVFIKNDQPSPDGDRPNVLVGSFPPDGHGSLNMYEVYGNVFVHNHREALFQASGRVSVHDNIFVDGSYKYPAVVLRKQNYPLKLAYIYNNTIYTSGKGIYFGTSALVDDAVAGNLVFGLTPVSGSILRPSDNVTDLLWNAPKYVRSPSFEIGSMDFYPLPGTCQGPAMDLSGFQVDTDYTLDFNGTPKTQAKGSVVFRGAYAGAGNNPGWKLQAGLKPSRPQPPRPAPTLVWIHPAGGQAGATVRATITGTDFTGDANVEVSGGGITVDNVRVVRPTELSVTLLLAGGSKAGSRGITVSTSSGRSNALSFRITSRQRADPQRRAQPRAAQMPAGTTALF